VKPTVGPRVQYTAQQIAGRVAEMGREISRTYGGDQIDVVAMLDKAFIFASDLVRQITSPVLCHFVEAELRDVHLNGHQRREVFFSYNPELKGRDVLVVDAVLHSGVTMEFFVRRLAECQPRSIRIAVLVDKPEARRVPLQPDFLGFSNASNKHLVGYGLPDAEGLRRNLPHILAEDGVKAQPSGRTRTRAGAGKRAAARRTARPRAR